MPQLGVIQIWGRTSDDSRARTGATLQKRKRKIKQHTNSFYLYHYESLSRNLKDFTSTLELGVDIFKGTQRDQIFHEIQVAFMLIKVLMTLLCI